MTCKPSKKGGVPLLMSTLPLDGAAGEPQVTEAHGKCRHLIIIYKYTCRTATVEGPRVRRPPTTATG